MFNSKLIRLLYANYRAFRYGFIFLRTKNFRTPKRICFNRHTIGISSPDDGTKLFKEIFLHDEYFLRRICRDRIFKIVDIGANVRFFSLTARSFFPLAEIHAYEPSKSNFHFLKENGLNFNFKPYLSAVGKENCLGNILESGDAGCLSNFHKDDSGTCQMISLSKVISRFSGNIDLLKLDCEGWEYELLSCAKEMEKVCYLTMEYHDKSFEQVREILTSINFSVLHFFEYPFNTGIILAKNLAYTPIRL